MTSKVERVTIPQKAVLWRFSSFDNYGQAIVSEPEEIDVEWPQGFTESNANQDSKESSTDEVVVNDNVALQSILWFGNYADLPSGTANPSPLYTVTGRRIQPDIKARDFRYTLTVQRFSNTLPTVV